jgi:hypothetical protein
MRNQEELDIAIDSLIERVCDLEKKELGLCNDYVDDIRNLAKQIEEICG